MNTKVNLVDRLTEISNLLPLERAMGELQGAREEGNEGIREAISSLEGPPEILAGLWLYVDDLNRSHYICQDIYTPSGSYWHAIVHRREGDFSNSKYWYQRAGTHPVIEGLGYDPCAFVDECEKDQGANSPKLIEMQRTEWKALFDWCVGEIG